MTLVPKKHCPTCRCVGESYVGLDPKDLRVDTFRAGFQGPRSVRITHLPTGLVETAEGTSEIAAKSEALTALTKRVREHHAE